jgi:hypothetical protein
VVFEKEEMVSFLGRVADSLRTDRPAAALLEGVLYPEPDRFRTEPAWNQAQEKWKEAAREIQKARPELKVRMMVSPLSPGPVGILMKQRPPRSGVKGTN